MKRTTLLPNPPGNSVDVHSPRFVTLLLHPLAVCDYPRSLFPLLAIRRLEGRQGGKVGGFPVRLLQTAVVIGVDAAKRIVLLVPTNHLLQGRVRPMLRRSQAAKSVASVVVVR